MFKSLQRRLSVLCRSKVCVPMCRCPQHWASLRLPFSQFDSNLALAQGLGMIDISLFSHGNHSLMTVKLTGRLTQSEYQVFLPHFESEVRHYVELRLLFELDSALEWEPRSRWRSLRFDSQHRTNISRLAIVGGDKHWSTWLANACAPMTIQRTLTFSSRHLAQAISWLKV